MRRSMGREGRSGISLVYGRKDLGRIHGWMEERRGPEIRNFSTLRLCENLRIEPRARAQESRRIQGLLLLMHTGRKGSSFLSNNWLSRGTSFEEKSSDPRQGTGWQTSGTNNGREPAISGCHDDYSGHCSGDTRPRMTTRKGAASKPASLQQDSRPSGVQRRRTEEGFDSFPGISSHPVDVG